MKVSSAIGSSAAAFAGFLTLGAGGSAVDGTPPVMPLGHTLTAVAEPARAGARPMQLTLTERAELQCGRIGPGPIVVTLPAGERMPARISPDAVSVNGAAPAAVTRDGRAVSLTPARPPGVICDVIGPGTVTVRFRRAAGLGNPGKPGLYTVTLKVRGQAETARLRIVA